MQYSLVHMGIGYKMQKASTSWPRRRSGDVTSERIIVDDAVDK